MNEFDYVFWFGDFNYKIEENFEEIFKNDQILLTPETVFELKNKEKMTELMKSNIVLSSFAEGPLEFLPTYPVNPNTNVSMYLSKNMS